jgi:hypothetical protein
MGYVTPGFIPNLPLAIIPGRLRGLAFQGVFLSV